MSAALSKLVREDLLHLDGIRKYAPARRTSVLFTADSLSDSVLFVESGYVKLHKQDGDGKGVVIGIVGSGQLAGEEALFVGGARQFSAEVIQEGVVYEIPRELFLGFCAAKPELWRHLAETFAKRQRELQLRVSLLCLYDVESRILHYLVNLALLFNHSAGAGQEYSIPLTQGEVAGIVGATRETTSTTLNALARQGLVRLGRRQLTIVSVDALQALIDQRSSKARGAAGG